MGFRRGQQLPGCPVPLGAASARYLDSLRLDETDAADLVRKAEPVRLKLLELDVTVPGRSRRTTIVEALALARGKEPHEVAPAVRDHLPRGRKAIGDVLLLTRAREALAVEAS
jgi:hypothetical protein